MQSKSCFLTIFPSHLLGNKGSCQDFYGKVQVFVSLKTRSWPKSTTSRSQPLNMSLSLKKQKKESSRFQCLQSRSLGAESSLYHQVFTTSFTVCKTMHMVAQKNCYVHHTQFSLLLWLMNQCLSTQGSYCQASNFMFNHNIEQNPWVAVFTAVINGLPLLPKTV